MKKEIALKSLTGGLMMNDYKDRNVFYKHTSESRTPPTLRTSPISIYNGSR